MPLVDTFNTKQEIQNIKVQKRLLNLGSLDFEPGYIKAYVKILSDDLLSRTESPDLELCY